MIVERFSKREVYSCENRQIFLKPVFGGARRRNLCPIGLTGSRIRHKTGKRKKRHERKNRPNLQQKFREVEDNFLKRQNCRAIGKNLMLWRKSFWHKMLKRWRARGRKRMRGKNRSGKGDCEPRRKGGTNTK